MYVRFIQQVQDLFRRQEEEKVSSSGNLEDGTIHQNMTSRKRACIVGETKQLNFRPGEFEECVGHQSRDDQEQVGYMCVALRHAGSGGDTRLEQAGLPMNEKNEINGEKPVNSSK